MHDAQILETLRTAPEFYRQITKKTESDPSVAWPPAPTSRGKNIHTHLTSLRKPLLTAAAALQRTSRLPPLFDSDFLRALRPSPGTPRYLKMAALLYYAGCLLAGYIALTMFFYALSLVLPKASFVARVLASYLSLIVCSLYGVSASVALRLVGRGQLAQWTVARSFKYLMGFATGVTFDVEDPRNHLATVRPAVFIGNHQTELDVLMLGCMFPKYCSVTAKASLKKVPFLGWFMALSGSVFIDRANSKDARQAMQGAANEIRDKRQSVYMFPEGTRSYAKEPMMLPFKKGAFHLAVQAQVPIVPVVVANYSHVLWVKGLVFNAGRIPCKGTFLSSLTPPFSTHLTP